MSLVEDFSVDALIAMPKRVDRVGNWAEERKHFRLESLAVADAIPFTIFVRVLRKMPEHFSIGLRYEERGRGTVLLRVNGDHGRHENPRRSGHFQSGPHLHTFRAPLRFQSPRHGAETRWAWPLSPECLALPMAWEVFCEQTRLQRHRRMDTKIHELYNTSRQVELPFPDAD